jgi:hypothetical protein
MRNGTIGFVGGLVCVAMVASSGCSSGSGTTGSAGSSGSSGTTGSAGTTGGGGTTGSAGSSGSSGTTGSGGSPQSITTLSGSKALGTLTAAEATQLCDDVKAYYRSAITKASSCKWYALFNASSSSSPTNMALQNNCTQGETACTQSSDTGPGTMTSCLPIPASCTATVAQYSTCIIDGARLLNQAASTLPSCSTITLADLTPVFDAQNAINAPPGCMPLADMCPALAFPIAN